MPADPWDALRAIIREVHLLGSVSGGPLRVVQLYDRLIDKTKMRMRGILDLNATMVLTRDGDIIYAISTYAETVSSAKVYWLPPTHDETVYVSALDTYNVDLFLASGFKGGQFISCDGIFVQKGTKATAYVVSGDRPTFPIIMPDENKPFVEPRSVVMGSRSPQTKQWYFAHVGGCEFLRFHNSLYYWR